MTQTISCVVKRSACAALGFAAVALLIAGCSGTAKIAQSSKGNVYLEEVTDWSFEANHPAVIDQTTMTKVVKGLYSDESRSGSSKMSAGGGKPMRIFSDEDAEFLAPLLAQGLSKAKPEQIVGFRVSSSAGSGSEPTTGSIYVQKGSIYFTISQGVKASGFMPDSVAHVEHAPAYAAAGSSGMPAMVIDYHALAKAPLSSLPVAKAAPKISPVATAAPSTTAASVKPQTVSSQTAVPMSPSELESPEISQTDKTKETIAKKESEITMLRKEASWMKRELRERDEEIKALKASKTSKVSAKPAPKKKPAEVYPFTKPMKSVSPDVDEFGLK